jgi:hypothetical protein
MHGLAVQLDVVCPALNPEIDRLFKPFSALAPPANSVWTAGIIKPFNLPEVSRQISPAAVPHAGHSAFGQLYSLDERHWLVDERWGMCQINVLKRSWRSWILPRTSLDPVRLAEAAVLWPLSQLLRTRGLHLIPAISIERNGWGALLLSSYDMQPELIRLLRAGYRIVGQRWTAIRSDNGKLTLLNMPGLTPIPTGRPEAAPNRRRPLWIDLTASNPWATADRAECCAAFMVEPGRRDAIHGRELNDSTAAIRSAWPMIELSRHRRPSCDPAVQLARRCRCFLIQLSRNQNDFVQLMETVRRKQAPARSLAA